jgi:hypothetical protein
MPRLAVDEPFQSAVSEASGTPVFQLPTVPNTWFTAPVQVRVAAGTTDAGTATASMATTSRASDRRETRPETRRWERRMKKPSGAMRSQSRHEWAVIPDLDPRAADSPRSCNLLVPANLNKVSPTTAP